MLTIDDCRKIEEYNLNIVKKSYFICTGCGNMIPSIRLNSCERTCCPDSSYISLDEYLKRSVIILK